MKDLIGYGFKIMALPTELQVTKIKKRKKVASRFRK